MTRLLALALVAIAVNGCSSAYYGTMEKMGVHKRDILVERVEEARNAQEQGQEQFRSALEQYQSVIAFEGGELEERYDQLKEEFEDSEKAAEAIRDRISRIEDVAEDLFDEWEEEIGEYSSKALKRDSQRKLDSTRQNYQTLITALRDSERRLDPALNTMRDQVLHLKHNLNAQAIASIKGESTAVMRDVDALLQSMQKSIQEANAFLAGMGDTRE